MPAAVLRAGVDACQGDPGMSSSELSFTLRNDRDEIARMFALLEPFCATHGVSDDDLFNLRLILDEAVINVILHGYEDKKEHEIAVSLRLAGAAATIHIVDDGVAYNPLDAPQPRFDLPIEERRIGGLGVHIIRSLASSVRYQRENGHNHLTVEVNIGPDAERVGQV